MTKKSLYLNEFIIGNIILSLAKILLKILSPYNRYNILLFSDNIPLYNFSNHKNNIDNNINKDYNNVSLNNNNNNTNTVFIEVIICYFHNLYLCFDIKRLILKIDRCQSSN